LAIQLVTYDTLPLRKKKPQGTNNPGTHNLNALLFVTTDMLANFVPHQDSVSTLTAVMLLKIFLQYWVECSGAPQPSPAAEATYQQQAATPESAQQLRTLLDLPAESEFWKTVVTFRERDGHGGQSSLQEMAKQSLSAALFHASIQFLSSVSVKYVIVFKTTSCFFTYI
jgi:hypothetical protein